MKTEFARLLAQTLVEHGMAQHRLAMRSGVGPVTINRLVNGVRPPTEWQLLRIGIGLTGDLEQIKEINRLLDEAGLKVFGEAEQYWSEEEDDEHDEDR
jgi:transcriptional regulator with XRE-family HTH domain